MARFKEWWRAHLWGAGIRLSEDGDNRNVVSLRVDLVRDPDRHVYTLLPSDKARKLSNDLAKCADRVDHLNGDAPTRVEATQIENRYGLYLDPADFLALETLVNERARNCRNADDYTKWDRIARAVRTASIDGYSGGQGQ